MSFSASCVFLYILLVQTTEPKFQCQVVDRLQAARIAAIQLEQSLAKCATSSVALQQLFGTALPAHEVCLLFDAVFLPEDLLRGSPILAGFCDGGAFTEADLCSLWESSEVRISSALPYVSLLTESHA